MSLPKAMRGDDDYAEVRPKRSEPMPGKIPSTNPLSFADKSAQAVGPMRGAFEPPPQAMDPAISPRADQEFRYPARGTPIPQAVLEHPMKAKGYLKHTEKIKRELEDLQDKFSDLMSHAVNEDSKRQHNAKTLSKENQFLEKKANALELEVDSLKTGKEKPRKGDEIITDLKGILSQNEQLYQANTKWGSAYHDLEEIYQRRLDEDDGMRKKLELRARQLAIENHSLKNKFSEYGRAQPDLFAELGMGAGGGGGGEEGLSESESEDYLSSDDSDYDKISPAVREVMRTRSERRKMWKDLVDEGKGKKGGKAALLSKTDKELKKKMAKIKMIRDKLDSVDKLSEKAMKGSGFGYPLLKGGKGKKPLDTEAPDIRALMDHIAILHQKLDRYRNEAKSIEGENKRLKDDVDFITRRYQTLLDRVELGRAGGGALGAPLRSDNLLSGYGAGDRMYGMGDRLLDYY